MTTNISRNRVRPILRSVQAALLAAAGLAAFSNAPAMAQEGIRIAVNPAELRDPTAMARIRREIASAASAFCETGGVAGIYRSGAARCREQVIADAERQLRARAAPQLAGGAPAPAATVY